MVLNESYSEKFFVEEISIQLAVSTLQSATCLGYNPITIMIFFVHSSLDI